MTGETLPISGTGERVIGGDSRQFFNGNPQYRHISLRRRVPSQAGSLYRDAAPAPDKENRSRLITDPAAHIARRITQLFSALRTLRCRKKRYKTPDPAICRPLFRLRKTV